MFDNIKIDFIQVSFYLWIVVIAAIFSIFSIKYNPAYIYFGFITFAYGIVGHIVFKTFDSMQIKGLKNIILRIELETITIGAWLYFIVKLS